MRELVVDVSRWDGDVDLARWRAERGCWGVIVKFGGSEPQIGRYADPRAEDNYRKALACGLHVGAYYYGTATTVAEAEADAAHCAGLLDGHALDLPVYYDVEDPAQLALSPRALTDVIRAFCDAMARSGHLAGVYTGGSAWMHNVIRSELLAYPDWIAAWAPEWPEYAPEGDVGMWQQGSMSLDTGAVAYADVDGHVDCDWCCIDYPSRIAGTKEETVARNTVEGAMAIAYADLGYYAPSDPEPGSKAGRYCAKLMGQAWLAGPSTEVWWCCMWVSMVLAKADVTCPGFPAYNTDVAWEGGARTRAVDKAAIRRGDVLIFDWDPSTTATDHVGFATGSPKNGYVETIEGNVGNAVREKVRPLGSVRYAIRPQYADAAPQSVTASTSVRSPAQDGRALAVDGIGGRNTVCEWQAQMGTTRDGEVSGQDRGLHRWFEGIVAVSFGGGGSQLVRAVQRRVGAGVDGVWGRETSTKVQRWLIGKGYSCGGCGADGLFGHDSVCALQRSLNDGAWKGV